jgi:hypothetical protein
MSVSSRLLAASAVLTALFALFWPQLESLATTYLSHNSTDSKCPLVCETAAAVHAACACPASCSHGCLLAPGIHWHQPSQLGWRQQCCQPGLRCDLVHQLHSMDSRCQGTRT